MMRSLIQRRHGPKVSFVRILLTTAYPLPPLRFYIHAEPKQDLIDLIY